MVQAASPRWCTHPPTSNFCLLSKSCPIFGVDLCCGVSVPRPRKLFYPTFVGGKNAISVCHMTKVIGAIFHPARIERLMKADDEGRVFNKRGWGEMRCIKMKEEGEKKSIHAPPPSSVSSIVPPNRFQGECLKRRGGGRYPNPFPAGITVEVKGGVFLS